MAGRMLKELKQRKPFAHPAEEATLNILRTADCLRRVLAEALKAHELSHSGYNVLRILRGAGDEGLTCGEIASRMLSHDPDITRLIDRLEQRGWVTRARDGADRRVVICRIAPAGLGLLRDLDPAVTRATRGHLAHLDHAGLDRLIDALEGVRASIEGPLD